MSEWVDINIERPRQFGAYLCITKRNWSMKLLYYWADSTVKGDQVFLDTVAFWLLVPPEPPGPFHERPFKKGARNTAKGVVNNGYLVDEPQFIEESLAAHAGTSKVKIEEE